MKFSELALLRWMTQLNIGLALGLLMWLASLPTIGHAHGTAAGDLQLDHPYAVPSAAGEPHGKAYLRGINNAGTQADKLLSASTPVAAKVELHSLKADAGGLRGKQLDVIELPAKTVTKLRHTGDYQLTLIGLKAPLKDGDRFELTLNFEHAGSKTVKVWVQTPREAAHAH
ncbi:copper chaperone PCu(A)C [Rhodoferax sp.]|uniref:copper chaperone PCu(A)C n=1 Tax=Rhodoferax sp. TaxID=50421 RepID=UPI002613E32A|nr:copper chaperone PCu(A)C [Rhodoferax sp.]MDD2810960.1 copper chaperone PCu(A)C [Rhodoferax sp.]MDD4942411.1 copper chaperone PCu(A)C [Rhodoferax sp.]MDD5479563.1 copper chaperone PCu(A)C [Rhodoferax sp.]